MNVGHHVAPAARPLHLEPIGLLVRSQPDVLAQIVLSEIGRARFHLTDLRAGSRRHTQPGADAITIALLTDEVDDERVAMVAVVAKEIGRLPVVGDEQIEIAVVVDVAGGEAAAHFFEREPGAGGCH